MFTQLRYGLRVLAAGSSRGSAAGHSGGCSYSKGYARCHRSRPGSSPNHWAVSQSFPQAPPSVTRRQHPDGGPDLSSEDGTKLDGRGSTCNPLPACSDRWQSVWQSTRRHQMEYLVTAPQCLPSSE
jgi:hypothetical protein